MHRSRPSASRSRRGGHVLCQVSYSHYRPRPGTHECPSRVGTNELSEFVSGSSESSERVPCRQSFLWSEQESHENKSTRGEQTLISRVQNVRRAQAMTRSLQDHTTRTYRTCHLFYHYGLRGQVAVNQTRALPFRVPLEGSTKIVNKQTHKKI